MDEPAPPAPGQRIEMTRYPNMTRFFGNTSEGRPILIDLDQSVWEALGEPETFVIRVRG